MTDHDRHQDDVGAYLLGALEPAEQSAFEGHLATCPECRAEVERLRAAADALPRSVEPFTPPASLKRSLMEAVREDSAARAPAAARRPLLERLGIDRLLTGMRPELAWVSAAFVLVVGIALGVAVSQLSGGDDNGQRVVAAVVDHTRVRNASATLTLPKGHTGPAQLVVTGMPAPKPGQVYEIWLKRGDQAQPATLFSVDSQGDGVGAIPEDLSNVSAILVTREHTGGAKTPSEVPIISARI
jgi:anti-sigma factor RsiW